MTRMSWAAVSSNPVTWSERAAKALEAAAAEMNPDATVVKTRSCITVEEPERIRGARVLVNEGLVIDDGGGEGKLAILGVEVDRMLTQTDGHHHLGQAVHLAVRYGDPGADTGGLVGIESDDSLDCPATDRAEPHFVASEHDAVGLGPKEPFRLIAGPLEGPDPAGKVCRQMAPKAN